MIFYWLTPFSDSFVVCDWFELVIYFHNNERDDKLNVFTVNFQTTAIYDKVLGQIYANFLLHWSSFVSYLAEKDDCDGQDLLVIAQDAEVPRHYIPIIKERLKLKKLIAMNVEPRDDKSFSSFLR